MNAIHGIYHNGSIELTERPLFADPVEVLVIFSEQRKIIKKIGGMFKNAHIDYEAIEDELRQLSKKSAAHILQEASGDNENKPTGFSDGRRRIFRPLHR